MELESLAERFKRLAAETGSKPTWYDRNKAAIIQRRYGITLETAQQKLEDQQFLCALCACHLDHVIGRNAQIEHDHKTGRFRGVVCLRCNLGLGWIQDNPELVDKIVAYLAAV